MPSSILVKLLRPCSKDFFNGKTNALRNNEESFVLRVPLRVCNRYCIGRESLEFTKRRSLPINGTKDDGNDTSFSLFVTLHCPLHLRAIAVIGVHKVRAH